MAKTKTHPDAVGHWTRQRARAFARAFAAKPALNAWQWADAYRFADEYTAGGRQRWRTAFTPYVREILAVVSDRRVHRVVVMKSAQVGFTQGVLMNIFGYFAHQEPCPMLWVRPSETDARAFSKKKLEPVIKATPVLRALITDDKPVVGRARTDTILAKYFPGGFVQLVGAVSPMGLKSDSVRVVLIDEVDGMDGEGAGHEGDQVELARKRTETFWDWLVLIGGTPAREGFSRTADTFAQSDQRYYHVPCPHCGHPQKLEWGGKDEAFGMKWSHTVVDGERRVVPGSAYYLCASGNGCVIEEKHKRGMIDAGEWIAARPGAEIVGFHLNALVSPFPGAKWESLVTAWLQAQGDTVKLKVFVNQVLGLPFKEPGERVEAEGLLALVAKYEAEVPRGVGLLTAAVDVQGDRIEWAVKGWGHEQESWLIDRGVVYGDFAHKHVQEALDALLDRDFQHEGGATLRVKVMCIDTGGHHAEEVSRYVGSRSGRGVRAVRGASVAGKPIWNVAKKPSKYGIKVFGVGTERAKDMIYTNLRLTMDKAGDTDRGGPRVMHFPPDADLEYFRQLTAERAQKVSGVRRYVKPKNARNESLDLEVYCLAGLMSLGPTVFKRLGVEAERLTVQGAQRLAAMRAGVIAAVSLAPAKARPVRRRGTRAKKGWD